MAQLDKGSKSSIMELCRHTTGQYLTRVYDSSQVGARLSQHIQSEYDHSKIQATERCKESCHGQTESL